MNKMYTILDILQKSAKPLSVHEVYHELAGKVAERSIRRHLANLRTKELVRVLGGNKNRLYQALANTAINTTSEYNLFSSASLAVLEKLRTPLYLREPCSYNDDWLAQYIPNQNYYLTKEQRALLHQHGDRTLEEQPAGTLAHKIYQSLLIDLSFNSARLEGNTYSLADTKYLLLDGIAATDKLDSEKIMILNHKDAIRYLIENVQNVRVNEESIRTLHYLLADGLVLPELAGHIRDEAVKVSGSVYTPLAYLQQIQPYFVIILDKAAQILDPYEQSIFLLINLSYLQAFIDVNKRTARLACNIPLVVNNLIPIAFKDIDVNLYRSAVIAIYEFNDPKPLIDLYIWSYVKSADEYQTTIQDMGFDAMRVKYRSQRRKLLSELIKNMIIVDIISHIKTFSANNIPAADRAKFIADVQLDIDQLDETRIAGLGISKNDMQTWLDARK